MAVFGAGALALVASVLLVLLFRFERFVGLRYLRRVKPSRTVTIVLVASTLTAAAWFGVFLASRGHSRALATVAVVMTAEITQWVVIPTLLLRFFSVFTTVSTLGIVKGVAALVVVLSVTSGFEREF